MKKIRKVIATLVAAVCALMLTAIPLFADGTTGVPATVTVEGLCQFTANTTAIDFDTVPPGQKSKVETRWVNLTTNNALGGSVNISGTNWCTGDFNPDGTCTNPPTPYMPVGQTKYDKNTAVDPTTALLLSPGTYLINSSVPIMEWDDISYQVTIPPLQAADTYSQTITYDFSC